MCELMQPRGGGVGWGGASGSSQHSKSISFRYASLGTTVERHKEKTTVPVKRGEPSRKLVKVCEET